MTYNVQYQMFDAPRVAMEIDVSFLMGLDIGGTKIAGGVFTTKGEEVAVTRRPTPKDYASFMEACHEIFTELRSKSGESLSLGVGAAGAIDYAAGSVFAPNVPCLWDRPFLKDISQLFGKPAILGNDASCAALSEAVDGAGAGYNIVFGMIMGTGVGGGLIINQKLIDGPNGLTGEWGHLPLPFRDEMDGEPVPCGCGQMGCLDKTISGPALLRLYEKASGKTPISASDVTSAAAAGDPTAIKVLDRFYTTVAKACVAVIHTFDPDVIVLSGGLNALPGIYEEVPARWGKYALAKHPRTKFIAAAHGKMSGLRGAAFLGSNQLGAAIV